MIPIIFNLQFEFLQLLSYLNNLIYFMILNHIHNQILNQTNF